MSRQLFFSLLLTAVCALLVYLGAPEGVMLCGGGPCLIIIMEGNLAYGAIEGYEPDAPIRSMAAIARLKAAITASCALTSYASLYRQGNGSYLEGPVLQKIIDFHKLAVSVFRAGNPTSLAYDIEGASERLEKYNRRLVNLASSEDIYSES